MKPYAVVIEWDGRDGIFIATAPDVRGCRTDGATRAEVAANAEEAIAATSATVTGSGVPLPVPHFTALGDAIYGRAAVRSAQPRRPCSRSVWRSPVRIDQPH